MEGAGTVDQPTEETLIRASFQNQELRTQAQCRLPRGPLARPVAPRSATEEVILLADIGGIIAVVLSSKGRMEACADFDPTLYFLEPEHS